MKVLKNLNYITIKERVKMGAWFASFENNASSVCDDIGVSFRTYCNGN